MRRARWIGIGIIAVLLIAGVLLLVSRAPALSDVGVSSQPCIASGDTCLRFPTLSGDNLPGETFNLPMDFAGERNLVIVPFDEDQQVKASSWLPMARDFAVSYSDFAYYNLPIFPTMAAPMRAIIRAGMNFTISDIDLRVLTITAFLDDRDAFLAALDIPNTDTMQVFLVDGAGVVLWRGTGEYDGAQGEEVRELLSGNG